MAVYEPFPIETDPTALAEDAFAYLQDRWDGWLPSPANFDAGTIEAHARMVAELRDLAASVPDDIFVRFGTSLAGIPLLEATPASVAVTVTAIDNQGYTIEADTTMGARATGDQLYLFTVDADVVIPPGSTSTAAGAVALTAQEEGSASSGLLGPGEAMEVVDYAPWVATATAVAATSGGQDAEDVPDYLDRLATELQVPGNPVLPRDFAVRAQRDPDVDRALALDMYVPPAPYGPAESFNTQRAVTVAVVDAAGADPGSSVRARVLVDLQSTRESTFLVYIMPPTYTVVSVTYSAVAYPGFAVDDVQARANAALGDWLSPANFGVPPYSDERSWSKETKVRVTEIVDVLNRVDGLWYVNGPGIGGLPLVNGAAADLQLSGQAALPQAGTITGTVVAG